MGRSRGFSEEDGRYLESLPGAKVTRVNLPGVPAEVPKKSGIYKPSAMTDANAKHWDSKTEARFSHVLEDLVDEGRFRRWTYNDRKYRLADKTWYKPDFTIELFDYRNVLVEVKGGYVTDRDKLRIKLLAEMVSEPFFLAQWTTYWTITRLYSRTSMENKIPNIFEGVER